MYTRTIEELRDKFQAPGVSIDKGVNGLPKLDLTSSGGDVLHLYLHGAHLTHFQPAEEEPVLWMSRESWFQPGKPIRGGVPICWPWFGPHAEDASKPSHGLARLEPWTLQHAGRDEHGRGVVHLTLWPNDATRALWPREFQLDLHVRCSQMLELTLVTQNKGLSPMQVSEALHSYFAVSDVRAVRIEGLETTEYINQIDASRHTQPAEPITFDGEVDRAYLNTAGSCVLKDPGASRAIVVGKSGSQSTVVWNPHVAKSARMEDYGDDEWPGMVCIETANVPANAVTVAPGDRHELSAEISVRAL
jgi:D-hexose-6-phosphate mutarotase